MSRPFTRRRIGFSSSPIRLELDGVSALEFAGALPRGGRLHFSPPGEDQAERWSIEINHNRIIPCLEAERCWLVWPTEGTGDLDPFADLILWRDPIGHVNIGSSVRTFADGYIVDFIKAERNKTLATTPSLAYEMGEQINATFNKGTVEIAARAFAVWAVEDNPFRVLLYSRDFAGGYRLTRQWDSSIMAGGGSALEILEPCPPLGWKLTAYNLGAGTPNKFTFTVATTS